MQISQNHSAYCRGRRRNASVYGKRSGDVTSYQVNNFIVNVHINNKAKSLDELQEVECKKGRK